MLHLPPAEAQLRPAPMPMIGPLGGAGAGFGDAIAGRWSAVGNLNFSQIWRLLVAAATLAVLLSIDTLKNPRTRGRGPKVWPWY